MSDDVKRALGVGAKCCGQDCGLCSDGIVSEPAPEPEVDEDELVDDEDDE